MATMIKVDLLPLWHKKETEEGKRLYIQDVAKATGLAYSTIANLRTGKSRRFDAETLAALCNYFGVPGGQPVPFLTVHYNGDDQ